MQVLYLWEGYEQDAVAFLSAGETQIIISDVESPGCMAARMWCPHRTRRHLVELFGAGEPKQSQGVLPYCLFLEDPAKKMGQGQCVTLRQLCPPEGKTMGATIRNQKLKRKLHHRDFLCSYKQEKSVRSCVELKKKTLIKAYFSRLVAELINYDLSFLGQKLFFSLIWYHL